MRLFLVSCIHCLKGKKLAENFETGFKEFEYKTLSKNGNLLSVLAQLHVGPSSSPGYMSSCPAHSQEKHLFAQQTLWSDVAGECYERFPDPLT